MQVITSLFFPVRPKGKIGTLTIDCVVSESHKYDSDVTAYPTEDGASISEHIYNRPFKLSLSGVVSDTPVPSSFSSYIPTPQTHDQPLSKQAYDYLLELRNQRTVFTVVTGLQVYANMAFENITFDRDKDTGKALSFSVELTQIKKVSAQTKNVSRAKIKDKYDAKTQGTTTDNQGSQRTAEIDDTGQYQLDYALKDGSIYAGWSGL
jgi:hypothetical protein